MNLADINFTVSVHMDRVSLKWDKFSDTARYVVVRKRISIPVGLFDGTRIYTGNDISYDDYAVINGDIYYYRLIILPDKNDDLTYLTDNKCVCRAIALNFNSMDIDYAYELYNTFPEDVKYRDALLKGQNEPLKRFVRLFCYTFNKLNTYADTIINQTDVDTCDEIYLPYHAKWQGRFYDARFGADINRLYLKTMEEAEPFIGTKAGLTYILQRVFKTSVEIEEKTYGSCFTNDEDGTTNGSLMTNGCMCFTSIKLNFDDDNMWLSMDLVSSIQRIIIEYLPIRIGIVIISSLVSTDNYDASRMLDDYLHDYLYEVVCDDFVVSIEDTLFDWMYSFSEYNEVYKGFGILLNNGLMTNARMWNSDTDWVTGNLGSIIGRQDQHINGGFVTNSKFRENSIDSYKDRIIENMSDEYEFLDISEFIEDYAYELNLDKYEFSICSDEIDVSFLMGDMRYEFYKLNGNIKMYQDRNDMRFGLTGGLMLSNNLVTNPHTGMASDFYNHDSISEKSCLEYNGAYDETMVIESVYENEESDQSFCDELLDNAVDAMYDKSEIMSFGQLNDRNSLVGGFIVNSGGFRLSDSAPYVSDKASEVSSSKYTAVKSETLLDSISRASGGDESIGEYEDDHMTVFIRIRPESKICSGTCLNRGFYLTDISY